jgi:hypothetical protein
MQFHPSGVRRRMAHCAKTIQDKRNTQMTNELAETITQHVSPWAEVDDILGKLLRCSKGVWFLDNDPVDDGDGGQQVCLIMPTLRHGQVVWSDQKIVDRDVHLFETHPGFAWRGEGWSRYTSCNLIFVNGRSSGETGTFASSSWGGWRAIKALFRPYFTRGEVAFPTCTLHTKARPSLQNPQNVDPACKIVRDDAGNEGWTPRERFESLFPEVRRLPAPAATAALNKPAAEIVDDEIPF